MRKLIEDTSTDLKKEYYFDDDGSMTVNYTQDVEPIIRQNKIIEETNNGFNKDRTLKHVASIPASVILMWRKKYGVDVYKKEHWPKVKKLLNDPEWSAIRSGKGQI